MGYTPLCRRWVHLLEEWYHLVPEVREGSGLGREYGTATHARPIVLLFRKKPREKMSLVLRLREELPVPTAPEAVTKTDKSVTLRAQLPTLAPNAEPVGQIQFQVVRLARQDQPRAHGDSSLCVCVYVDRATVSMATCTTLGSTLSCSRRIAGRSRVSRPTRYVLLWSLGLCPGSLMCGHLDLRLPRACSASGHAGVQRVVSSERLHPHVYGGRGRQALWHLL